MNIQKRQSIQKLVIDQAGRDRLILNDLILGFQGAQTVAELIPQYHQSINHLEIKGNNIDSQGFQALFAALATCPNLKSIQAEWNSLGSGPAGLKILCHLVKTLPYLEFIDLKNNRITHQFVDYICTIIELNNKSLKVIDLRWNELGEIGAQAIYRSLAHNSALKYIGLEDNRISIHSLNQIETMLKNITRGTSQVLPRQIHTQPAAWINPSEIPQHTFPISQKAYPSMELQAKNGQLRAKIQNQQNQTEIYQSKIKLEIDKTLQKLKAKGIQMHQFQLKYDSLNNENLTLINQLREAQRILALEKQRCMGTDKGLNQQKSSLRTDKYNMNLKIQSLMEKTISKHQREIQDLQGLMNDKMLKLEGYYRERIAKKRSNRDKLSELKEDIIKLQMSKESAWDKVTDTYQNSNKNSLEERCRGLEELVAKAEFELKSEIKTGNHLTGQLSNIVLKGLQKEEQMEKDIFETQNSIKDMHNQMGTTNVEIQENHSQSALLESKSIDREAGVQMRRKYIKYILSQSSVNLEIERLKQEEDMKGERLLGQSVDMRIADLEKAIRVEQTQNKMIRNQYDKLLGQVEALAKKTIQSVLFEV